MATSIIGKCATCCACEAPELVFSPKLEWECTSITGTASLIGFSGYDDGSYDSGDPEEWEGNTPIARKWTKRTLAGYIQDINCVNNESDCETGNRYEYTGFAEIDESGLVAYATLTATTYDFFTCGVTSSTDYDVDEVGTPGPGTVFAESCSTLGPPFLSASDTLLVRTVIRCPATCEPPAINAGDPNTEGSVTETLSDEDTVYQALLRASETVVGIGCCAITESVGTTSPRSESPVPFTASAVAVSVILTGGAPSSGYIPRVRTRLFETLTPESWQLEESTIEVTTDEAGEASFVFELDQPSEGYTRCFLGIYSSKYNLAFRVPKVGRGCYRATWIERTVPTEGVGLTSLYIHRAGQLAPDVTVIPGSDGTNSYGSGARLMAVMNSSGGVSTLIILDPGSGYSTDHPPSVQFETAINGGTTPTGWTLTVSDGKIVGGTSGTEGNYLPTAVVAGDGSGATVTLTMNAAGGIATASLSAAGDGYVSPPEIVVTPKVGTPETMPVIWARYGTETVKCAVWGGTIPEGYDPDDSDTWPRIAATDYDFPEAEGSLGFVDFLTAACDCSACPE